MKKALKALWIFATILCAFAAAAFLFETFVEAMGDPVRRGVHKDSSNAFLWFLLCAVFAGASWLVILTVAVNRRSMDERSDPAR